MPSSRGRAPGRGPGARVVLLAGATMSLGLAGPAFGDGVVHRADFGFVAPPYASPPAPLDAFGHAAPWEADWGVREALKSRLRASPGEVAEFYRARGHRPLWLEDGRPGGEALDLIAALREADTHGLDPADYDPENLAALFEAAEMMGDPDTLAALELELSERLAAFAADLRRGRVASEAEFVAPELNAAPPSPLAALRAAELAPSLRAHLLQLPRLNPIYDGLRARLIEHRERWARLPSVSIPAGGALRLGASGPRVAALRARLGLDADALNAAYDAELADAVTEFQRAHGLEASGEADAATLAALNRAPDHYLRLLAVNLERARLLPADPGERYILVDAAAGQLWLYERGRETLNMKVVVGKQSQKTPIMAAMLRTAVFNPYWNIPKDLVPSSIGQRVLKEGLGFLEREGMQILSDYTDEAVELSPQQVDWRAVARGQLDVRVRQRPGPVNMLGRIKFDLDNPLGIRLHDTPLREHFASATRTFSSGCVRLEKAMELAEALMKDAFYAPPPGPEEEEVPLPEAIPVYITYFTALPAPGGIALRPDIYARDEAQTRKLAAVGAIASPAS